MKIVDCGFYIFYVDENTNQVINLPSKLKKKMIKEKEEIVYAIRSEFEIQTTAFINEKYNKNTDDEFKEYLNIFSEKLKNTVFNSFEYISSVFFDTDYDSKPTKKQKMFLYYNFFN